MCGIDGSDPPRCVTVTPRSNRAADSSSPETNCEDPDASMVTSPPRSAPVPRRVNGSASPSMSAPSWRSASRMVPSGRLRACASPSNSTTPVAIVAAGGRNRITVPARPQSTAAACHGAGVMRIVVPSSSISMPVPSACRRRHHQVGVAAAQRPGRRRRTARECGEHERPVGDRLRTGQFDGCVYGLVDGRGAPLTHAVHLRPSPPHRGSARPILSVANPRSNCAPVPQLCVNVGSRAAQPPQAAGSSETMASSTDWSGAGGTSALGRSMSRSNAVSTDAPVISGLCADAMVVAPSARTCSTWLR